MKRMQASISLKQLRRDPRHYVDLLNKGYAVSITDHRKTLAVAESHYTQHKPGTVGAVLEAIKNLPPLERPAPDQELTYKEIMAKYRLEDDKNRYL
jgi:hypothetical protein